VLFRLVKKIKEPEKDLPTIHKAHQLHQRNNTCSKSNGLEPTYYTLLVMF